MEKEFIPYELAIKLKKLGFNEPCMAYFEQGTLKRFEPSFLDAQILNSDFSSRIEGYHLNSCSAPLFQQTFRWLMPQIDDEYKVCLDENGWYIYNLENETYEGDEAIEKLIETIEKIRII